MNRINYLQEIKQMRIMNLLPHKKLMVSLKDLVTPRHLNKKMTNMMLIQMNVIFLPILLLQYPQQKEYQKIIFQKCLKENNHPMILIKIFKVDKKISVMKLHKVMHLLSVSIQHLTIIIKIQRSCQKVQIEKI